MRIQTFKNMKGIIYGADQKRIGCDKAGVLKIGAEEIKISAGNDEVMPLLFHGGTGDYDATFAAEDGKIYDLEKVEVRSGRISAPPPVAAELMELRIRADEAEDERDALREKISELENIFDTNSLNFLIR